MKKDCKVKISIKTIELENEVIANCPELDINCYGASRRDAVRRLMNVLYFYMDSARDLGLDVEQFDDICVDGENSMPIHTRELVYHKTGFINYDPLSSGFSGIFLSFAFRIYHYYSSDTITTF
jgi:hypothetical protein